MNPSQSISPSASLSVRVSPTLYIRPAFCLTILVYRLLCIALTDTIKQNVFSNSSPANVQTSNYQVIKNDVLYNSPKYGTLRILRPVYSDATRRNSTRRRVELCRYKRAFTHGRCGSHKCCLQPVLFLLVHSPDNQRIRPMNFKELASPMTRCWSGTV